MSSMTMRERMLAMVRGRPHDRVPFAQYENVNRCPITDIWDAYGRENVGVLRHTHFARFDHPNCSVERTDIERGELIGWRDTLHTPAGGRLPAHGRLSRHDERGDRVAVARCLQDH